MWSLVSQISLQCGFCQQHFFGVTSSRLVFDHSRTDEFDATIWWFMTSYSLMSLNSLHSLNSFRENLESFRFPPCIISRGDSESGETRMSAFTCPIDVFSLQGVVVIDPRETRSHIAEVDIRLVLKATLHRVRAEGWKSWCSSPWSVTCSTGSLVTTWRTLTSLSWRSGSGEVSLAAS